VKESCIKKIPYKISLCLKHVNGAFYKSLFKTTFLRSIILFFGFEEM